MQNVTAEVVAITPNMAREMLKMNAFNRPKADRWIKGLAEQMEKGTFVLTGETVIFSEEGFLLNGQHRLEAIILSGTTQQFIVVKGIDKAHFKYMDTGKNRSAADVLGMRGFGNTRNKAALAKVIMLYTGGSIERSTGQGIGIGNKVQSGVTNSDILDYVTKNAGVIDDCIKLSYHNYEKGKFLTFKDWGLLHYLLGKIDVEMSTEFLLKLSHGIRLEEGDAILNLRNKLLDAKMSKRSYTQRVRLGMIFKAWNIYRKGKTKGSIKFDPNEELPILL